MKTTMKVAGLCLAGALLISLAVGWIVERRALNRVKAQNGVLQEQVEDLVLTRNEFAAENERLLRLGTANETNTTQQPSSEMLRLRGEVGRLRVLERDAEQLRHEQMRLAQAKLNTAELELSRAIKEHSEKLIGGNDLSIAKWKMELLKAEAKGDDAEVARVRLRQAEEELARAAELRSQSLISETEYEQALRKVESTQTLK